jgi:hypothetical protein
MWLFYAPVVLWTFVLAVRHRGFGTIGAANPGMADGGIVGESKFEILSRLPAAWTIASRLIESGPLEKRMAPAKAWLACGQPLVFKPDVGQRGAGVKLVRTEGGARAYLSREAGPVLVQPYDPGPFEAGVFYYRFPGQTRGRILSITDKHFPEVTGDGCSTIEDLVWAHPRYRMQAGTFLTRLGSRRNAVPAVGERVGLGIAGNHAQGTLFRDGRHLITPALAERIDAIAREYSGFFVGRFDVRYSDVEAFQAGHDLAIVELNGATAESTNIYDPAGSLIGAYRQLFLQWSIVFAIGAANRRAGTPPTPARRLVHLVRAHLASSTPFPVSD